ncbi:family 43 glycosylhydrolase [Microbacter margulisiae]|uniref:Beta-xylosidase n=1 Tax=Microbacter margulisiae TaxID=1350067 RepID=A0A7W5H3H3_9PORP|nr:family 43 glycosylhydrolase [Microbacter margulisiae]MBB3188481.1 beta-xylosidase [Microbacter margulisiae]
MSKILIAVLLMQLPLFANAQYQTHPNVKGKSYYVNPIFAGDYPDPSILRVGDDYYMVNSSFQYYPGLLIWHSKDLINWMPVTHALHKYVGSVWAPDLVKYDNKYYIYFPANNTIYVVTASSVNGPWSSPVDLKISNGCIDPFHFAYKGKRYLYFSNGGYVPLSDDGLSVTGTLKIAYGGWPIPSDWSIECFCLEGPKLMKRGDYYYLTVAEGGTAGPPTSHMVISARSKSPFGPWVNSPYNPIIHTRSIAETWWSQGHGTPFEDTTGKWWIVFHGYEKGHYNMGRQTLLEPIEWTKDGWFKVPKGIETDKPIKRPEGTSLPSKFTLSDTFDGPALHPQWQFFDEYDTSRYHFVNSCLAIKGEGDSAANSHPLLCTASNHSYIAQVEMFLQGKATGGLVLFYNSSAQSGILAEQGNILADLRGWQFVAKKAVIKDHVFLRLKVINSIVDMYYSLDGKRWNKIENSFDTSCYNHNAFGGFLSVRIGLCSMGDGIVRFENFVYKPIK